MGIEEYKKAVEPHGFFFRPTDSGHTLEKALDDRVLLLEVCGSEGDRCTGSVFVTSAIPFATRLRVEDIAGEHVHCGPLDQSKRGKDSYQGDPEALKSLRMLLERMGANIPAAIERHVNNPKSEATITQRHSDNASLAFGKASPGTEIQDDYGNVSVISARLKLHVADFAHTLEDILKNLGQYEGLANAIPPLRMSEY
ncbi:MAG: hypothetical protein WCG83_01465 [Candidatus Peregrinibacteria bacterium]